MLYTYHSVYLTGVVVMMACIVITVMKCALSVPCPVPNCICKGVEAVCSGINMTYIPRLPIQMSRVSITNGHLRRISASTMINLTFNNISSLTLVITIQAIITTTPVK
jgi:hypothetical protein